MRSHEWRYTAWLRVVGYKQTPIEEEGGGDGVKVWGHNNIIVNWTYPPYFEELFDHREGDAKDTRKGRIYFGENFNVAYDQRTESRKHFLKMKAKFDNGLLPVASI
jgi:hypothetical protein